MNTPKLCFDLTKASALKVLERLVEKAAVHQGKANCVLITHVLSTSEDYIKHVNRIFPVSLVIAIPYSAEKEVVERLQQQGFAVFLPDSVDAAFLEAGIQVEAVLQNNKTPLVVQEVGGYLAGYANKLSAYSHFIGIVEDTNNGHWRYADAGEQLAPVLSMAQSPIKDVEDTVIGDSVVYSTERIFREEFQCVMQGLRTGVIGYGKIGTSTAIGLKGRECPVSVYDIDPCKCLKARFEGYRINPLSELLEQSELIIGCTGKTSIREGDIGNIRDNAVLVSGSAKNEEFDLQAFDRVCRKEEISPIIWKYTQADGRCFYLLNRGTPVNFRDRSILGFILDMIYSELFLCMQYLVEGKAENGLRHSPEIIHNTVAQEWLSIYEPSFTSDEQDKVWTYPDSLVQAVTHTFRLQTGQVEDTAVNE